MFILIFREREQKKERNINVRKINQLLPVLIPTGDQTSNLGTCPDQEWNPEPFSAGDDTPTNQASCPGKN